MNKVSILAALAIFILSCGDSSTNINGAESDANQSSNQGGAQQPDAPSNPQQPSSSSRPSSSSAPNTPQQTAANAIVLTLTYWQTTDTDVGGLDPKIYFNVIAYKDGKSASNKNSDALINAQDISATWSGSKKSSPVPFASQADSIAIYAIVIEKDTFSDDDISPGYYVKFYPPFYEGTFGSHTLDYGYGKSMVKFDYEFVWQ